jgi:hypothetical protein
MHEQILPVGMPGQPVPSGMTAMLSYAPADGAKATLQKAIVQSADPVVAQVMNRAVLAGQLLAHILMSGAHGGRPVTLIGFSMGAR